MAISVHETAWTSDPSTPISPTEIAEPESTDVTRVGWHTLASGPGPWLGLCQHVWITQSWFIAAAILYLLIGFALGAAYEQSISLGMYNDAHLVLYGNFLLAAIVWRMARQLYRHRPARPLRFVWADLTREFVTPWRIFNALPALILLPLVLSMVTSLKRIIPVIAPFSWDPALTEFDRLLHGGYQPWELLQPLLGYPLVTYIFSVAYALPALTLVLMMQFWLTFSASPRRIRFLLTYLLCWTLLGTGLAILFSSAGPVYYGRVAAGPDPFAPLLAYLSDVGQAYELPSLIAQTYLWTSYEKDYLGFGNGISAMPSLHLSMAFLLVLVCWRTHWSIRLATILFLAVLLAGSVHLAWHYAVDGYVGIAVTGLIYLAVNRALARLEGRVQLVVPAHGGKYSALLFKSWTGTKASALTSAEEPQLPTQQVRLDVGD